MSNCPEPDNHITDNVKVVLNLSNHSTRKRIIKCHRH